MIAQLILPDSGICRIVAEITGPEIPKVKIAIPDFKDFSNPKDHPEFSTEFPAVISNDLDLSGYFDPVDQEAFLDEDGPLLTEDNIQFRNWSVIGADLLLKGGYTCIGRSVEVEVRLYDAYWGKQVLGKKYLGKINDYTKLMHRIGNDIIRALTGHKGMFLSRIVFAGNATGHKEIYICDFDGQNIKQITSDKSIALLPRWSPQGDQIAFNSYMDGGPMLYVKNISSGRVKRVSGRKGLNTGASWMPDGSGLALTMSYKGNPDIFSIDPAGKIIKQITNHWAIDVSASYSPDGSRIVFVSNRSGTPQLYVKDLNSGREERITFDEDMKYNTSPVWSSMDRIAFAGSNNGHFDIYTIHPDGTGLRQLTDNQQDNEDPCWSQDGRYIVFSSNRDGSYHLFLMNAYGQNQRRITFQKGDQTTPSWSPY